jgi:tensin
VKALEYIADRKGIAVENLTIPSQPRYLTYFSNMLDGVKPRSEPLLLRRVIMNTIPIYGNNGGGEDSQGCCPYLQLFKGGKLISTSVPVNENDVKTKAEGNNKALLQWSKASDGCVSFNVDCALQGDILLRARHASNTGQRISMFRAAFHTGYVPAGVLRLTKEWLDGAADSSRFSDDFFIDLIFAPMGVRLPGDEDGSSDISPPESGGKDDGERGGLKAPGGGPPPPPGKLGVVAAPSDSGLLIDASSADRYEQTLHNDSRFWEAVGARKNKAKSRKSRKFKSVVRETFTLDDGEDGSYDEDDDMVSNVVKARSTTMDRVRESKDRDLIEALAQAEAEDQDGDSNRAGLEDSELNISGAGVESVGLGLSATPAKQGGSGAGEGGAQEAVSKELAELAELEKELGLDSSAATATSDGSSAGGGGGEAGGADGAGAEDGDGDLDDLDDLERYLASIQS